MSNSTGIDIDESAARAVLDTVDHGLSPRLGKPEPGHMCVEAAVCFALGLPHGDDPECVSFSILDLMTVLNDSCWSSPAARARGLRRLAVAQLGTRGDSFDEISFAKRVSELTIRKVVPSALRFAASALPEDMAEHAASLEEAASRCEAEGTKEAAESAALAASVIAALATESALQNALSTVEGAMAAVHSAFWSAKCAGEESAPAAAQSAFWSAECAAVLATLAAEDADAFLSEFAEDVVQILCELRAVGAQFLHLTEEAK